jgi:hypothetical protein
MLQLLGAQTVQPGGKAVDRLLLAVDRIALHDDRAQQNPQCQSVRDGATPISRRHMLFEQRLKSDALNEVIDEG